jgi:hypothetical protein
LTRVTRIFQKSVFTEIGPEGPGGMPRRVFCCATAWRGRVRRLSRFAKKQENTEEITAMQFEKGRAQLSRARGKCAPPCPARI